MLDHRSTSVDVKHLTNSFPLNELSRQFQFASTPAAIILFSRLYSKRHCLSREIRKYYSTVAVSGSVFLAYRNESEIQATSCRKISLERRTSDHLHAAKKYGTVSRVRAERTSKTRSLQGIFTPRVLAAGRNNPGARGFDAC